MPTAITLTTDKPATCDIDGCNQPGTGYYHDAGGNTWWLCAVHYQPCQCVFCAEQIPPTPRREVVYNRFDKCYDLFLDGQIVGYAWTHDDGDKILDQLVYDRLQPQPPTTPAAQMAALAEQYAQAKADGRLLEAAELRAQAKALEAAHHGVADLVLAERRKAA
jgi:hypothetical protein